MPRPGASQAELYLACALPASDGPRTAIYEVASQALREWLRLRLREETGATYGVQGSDWTLRGGETSLWLHANIENRRLLLALQTIRDLWAGIERDGASGVDVLEVRDELTRDRLVGYETSDGLASSIAWAWNLGWPLTWADDAARYTTAVTPEAVTEALRTCARNQTLALTGDEAVIRKALAELKASPSPAPRAAPSPAAASGAR
jgi:zinc protease